MILQVFLFCCKYILIDVFTYFRYFEKIYDEAARKKSGEKIPVVSVALPSPRNSIVVGADARSRENIFPAAPSLPPSFSTLFPSFWPKTAIFSFFPLIFFSNGFEERQQIEVRSSGPRAVVDGPSRVVLTVYDRSSGRLLNTVD